jgi:hypothetical protein
MVALLVAGIVGTIVSPSGDRTRNGSRGVHRNDVSGCHAHASPDHEVDGAPVGGQTLGCGQQPIPGRPYGVLTMTTTPDDREGEAGPDRSPSGPREANDPGSTRYGTNAGSGANEPKHDERKEIAGRSTPRQGGDQTRPNDDEDR